MIKIVDNDIDFNLILSDYPDSSFISRISSLYYCYGCTAKYVDFWVQYREDNTVSSIISQIDGRFTLALSEKSDIAEINEFLGFVNTYSVMFEECYDVLHWPLFDNNKMLCGDVLRYSENIFPDSAELSIVTPSVKEQYALLCKCRADDFIVPPYEAFALDVANRKNKRICRVYGAQSDNELASCVMTVAESENSAIIGAVATDPRHRKQGIGSKLVRYITSELVSENKTVFVYSANERNTAFYELLGYVKDTKWKEIIIQVR